MDSVDHCPTERGGANKAGVVDVKSERSGEVRTADKERGGGALIT